MKIAVGSLIVLAGVATVATAQPNNPPFEIGTRVSFEVFDGASWSNSVNVLPGSTVPFRITVSYIGTRTDLLGLGNMRIQPTFSNIDNTLDANGQDNLAPWRGGGTSGNNLPGTMVTQAEAANPALLDMGRVFPFGSTAMNAAGFNNGTTYRHSGGANGAPAGSWFRLSGSGSSNWPLPTLSAAQATAANLQNILRGVAISQLAQASAGSAWQGGTQGIVVFRGSIALSNDDTLRSIELSAAQGGFLRHGSTGSAVDDRYVAWQQNATDLGNWRTAVDLLEGSINVVPTPASLALLGLGGLVAARRRRA